MSPSGSTSTADPPRYNIAEQAGDIKALLDDPDGQVEISGKTCRSIDLWREYLALFAQCVIRGPAGAPYSGRFIIEDFHDEWATLVNEHRKLCIEAHRDSGKSHFFAVAYPIWMAWLRKPGELGYILSGSAELVAEVRERLVDELVNNPKLAHLVPPDYERRWNAGRIKLTNGSVIRFKGFKGRIRGAHPAWVVEDDVLTDDDLYSETVRKRHKDYHHGAVSNMVGPRGQQIVVGTPTHHADLYADLAANSEWVFRRYAAIKADGTPLAKLRYDLAQLAAKKREIGPTRYGREFDCRAMSDESSLFPSRFFEGGDVRQPYSLGRPFSYWQALGMSMFTGVDFAESAEIGSDFTVIFTLALDQLGNRWLANIRRGRGWSYQRQLDEIKEEYIWMRPELIYTEANVFQRIYAKELIRTTGLPIVPFYTLGRQPKGDKFKGGTASAGKHDELHGVPSLRIEFENRKWRIPRGSPADIEATDAWIGEMNAVSQQDGKVVSAGAHKDLVMATWMADLAARQGSGFAFDVGDAAQPEDLESDIERIGGRDYAEPGVASATDWLVAWDGSAGDLDRLLRRPTTEQPRNSAYLLAGVGGFRRVDDLLVVRITRDLALFRTVIETAGGRIARKLEAIDPATLAWQHRPQPPGGGPAAAVPGNGQNDGGYGMPSPEELAALTGSLPWL